MRQWQPIWHGSPQQIRQATRSSPQSVFISENRKCDPATAASYRAIRAATIATSSDPNGVVQVTENAPLHWTFEMYISLLLIAVSNYPNVHKWLTMDPSFILIYHGILCGIAHRYPYNE